MIQGNDACIEAKYVLKHRLLMTRGTTESTPYRVFYEIGIEGIEIHEHFALA